MGLTPSVKLDQGPSTIQPQPKEFDSFDQVRFELGAGNYVHLYVSRSGESVAHYEDGVGWIVTDGAGIGDSSLDGTIWGIILGQAK